MPILYFSGYSRILACSFTSGSITYKHNVDDIDRHTLLSVSVSSQGTFVCWISSNLLLFLTSPNLTWDALSYILCDHTCLCVNRSKCSRNIQECLTCSPTCSWDVSATRAPGIMLLVVCRLLVLLHVVYVALTILLHQCRYTNASEGMCFPNTSSCE